MGEAGGAPERVHVELAKGVVNVLGWLVLSRGRSKGKK